MKRHERTNAGWIFVVFLLWMVSAGGVTAAEDANVVRPDLTGIVRDQEGKPLRDATVFIYSAGPKEGVGILCPTCYLDCRKRTQTDASGRFKIESLDPKLLFRVLVVAKNFKPEFVSKVDPAAKPIEASLKPRRTDIKPGEQAKGRVLDPGGKPVGGAVVTIRNVTRGESTQFGGHDDMDQVTVTDDEGLFVISGESPFDSVGVDVEARAFAKGIFQRVPTDGKSHDLTLTEGAGLVGRLVRDGQPLGGVEIGISGKDRDAMIYVGDFTVGTDKDGKFALANLPSDREYQLYTKMSSMAGKGALTARSIRLKKDGSLLELGDVAVSPAFKVEGQLRLSDGKPVPAKTRVMLSREDAWDFTQTEADAQGRFVFEDVPQEAVSLSAGVKGYRLSARNKSWDGHGSLTGNLKSNKTGLVLEFEPAPIIPENPRFMDVRDKPLQGIESTGEVGQPKRGP